MSRSRNWRVNALSAPHRKSPGGTRLSGAEERVLLACRKSGDYGNSVASGYDEFQFGRSRRQPWVPLPRRDKALSAIWGLETDWKTRQALLKDLRAVLATMSGKKWPLENFSQSEFLPDVHGNESPYTTSQGAARGWKPLQPRPSRSRRTDRSTYRHCPTSEPVHIHRIWSVLSARRR